MTGTPSMPDPSFLELAERGLDLLDGVGARMRKTLITKAEQQTRVVLCAHTVMKKNPIED